MSKSRVIKISDCQHHEMLLQPGAVDTELVTFRVTAEVIVIIQNQGFYAGSVTRAKLQQIELVRQQLEPP